MYFNQKSSMSKKLFEETHHMDTPVLDSVSTSAATELPADALEMLRNNANEAACLLKGLANRDRLMLLCQLVTGEKTVSELERLTGIRQPSLSQQLGVLRNEGLVHTRRDGKWIYYRLESEKVQAILQTLYQIYCGGEHP
ncbi:hypothetical protein GCM10027182_15610 [Aquaspirillum soli]|jgi:DNA-binding transcriptional ArsR family regulator